MGKKKKKRQQSKVIAFKRMTSHKQTKLNAHMKGNKSDVSNLKLTLSLNKKDSLQRQFNSLGQQNYKVLDKVYGKLNSYLSLQYPEWKTSKDLKVWEHKDFPNMLEFQISENPLQISSQFSQNLLLNSKINVCIW